MYRPQVFGSMSFESFIFNLPPSPKKGEDISITPESSEPHSSQPLSPLREKHCLSSLGTGFASSLLVLD